MPPTPASTSEYTTRARSNPCLPALPGDDAPLSAWVDAYTRGAWPLFAVYGLRTVRASTTGTPRLICGCGRPATICRDAGKHPLVDRSLGLLHGLQEATLDRARLLRVVIKYPRLHLAVRTGSAPLGNGAVVLDEDPRHHGDDSLAELERRYGRLPEGPVQLTGGGGRHYLFAHPGGGLLIGNVQNDPTVLGPGIDIRGDGGYVLLAPSGHVSGGSYCWELSSRPDELPLPALPGWLLERLTRRGPGVRAPADPTWAAVALRDGVPEGQREQTAFRLACRYRHYGLAEPEVVEIILAFAARCTPPLDPGEALAKVENAYGRYEPGGAAPGGLRRHLAVSGGPDPLSAGRALRGGPACPRA